MHQLEDCWRCLLSLTLPQPQQGAANPVELHIQAMALRIPHCAHLILTLRSPYLDPYFRRFVTTLELAVRFGKTLVVEEAESIEPFIHPLLTGDMQGQGSGSTVRIGDRLVDYNKDFRLMLVSRSPQPKLAVDAAALLMIVNFSITRSGTFQPRIHCSWVSINFMVLLGDGDYMHNGRKTLRSTACCCRSPVQRQ